MEIVISHDIEEYKKDIQIIEKQIEKMVKNIVDGYDHSDIVVLIVGLSNIFTKMKFLIDRIKNIKGNYKLTIYSSILANTINRIIKTNENLTIEEKENIETYFSKNGVIDNIINTINDIYNTQLDEMDINKDDEISKTEFKEYVKKKCCDNEKISEYCVSCCFPFLSGGNNIIHR